MQNYSGEGQKSISSTKHEKAEEIDKLWSFNEQKESQKQSIFSSIFKVEEKNRNYLWAVKLI